MEKAMMATNRSLDIKGNNQSALINKGTIYYEKREFEKSITQFLKALEIKRTPLVTLNLSKAYLEIGEKEEALKYALEAFNKDNKNEKCIANLSNQYAENGQSHKAIKIVTQAIEENKMCERLYITASNLLCKEKLYQDARAILESGKISIKNSHIIDGELARVRFLEEGDEDKEHASQWSENIDCHFEDCRGKGLIISFGSNGKSLENEKTIPQFNFMKTLKDFEGYDKLYVRDLDRLYYMKGIKNSAPSINELKKLLLKYINAKEYTKIVTIGASSGGFGALLYGNLIEADYMIALNPQTVLNEKKSIIRDNIFAVNTCKYLENTSCNDNFYLKYVRP